MRRVFEMWRDNLETGTSFEENRSRETGGRGQVEPVQGHPRHHPRERE